MRLLSIIAGAASLVCAAQVVGATAKPAKAQTPIQYLQCTGTKTETFDRTGRSYNYPWSGLGRIFSNVDPISIYIEGDGASGLLSRNKQWKALTTEYFGQFNTGTLLYTANLNRTTGQFQSSIQGTGMTTQIQATCKAIPPPKPQF